MTILAPTGLLKTMAKFSLSKIVDYFKEVRTEVKKVTWPTRKETIKKTLMVLGITVLVSLFLGLIDYVFSTFVIKNIIR